MQGTFLNKILLNDFYIKFGGFECYKKYILSKYEGLLYELAFFGLSDYLCRIIFPFVIVNIIMLRVVILRGIRMSGYSVPPTVWDQVPFSMGKCIRFLRRKNMG